VPFKNCQQRSGKSYKVVPWQYNKPYSDLCQYWNDTPYTSAGWHTGTQLSWLDPSRTVSQILIDESTQPDPNGCKAHLAAAYLNACKFPGASVMTATEVQDLCTNGRIGNGGYVLTAKEIRDFCEQSWG
jgi:hypothetical protein